MDDRYPSTDEAQAVHPDFPYPDADPDPLRGIARLTARWAAAFVLDSAGATPTKRLGTESIARKLRDGLPGGDGALRAAVWKFMRPMLSPALASLNRDAFVTDDGIQTAVDLYGHNAPSDLAELALGEEPEIDATKPWPSLGRPPAHRSGRTSGTWFVCVAFCAALGRSSTSGSYGTHRLLCQASMLM